jgi:hypothetical protein
MKNEIDYEWFRQYIDDEIHRLGKVVRVANENLSYNEPLLALQIRSGKSTKETESKILHSKMTLAQVLPRIEKLQEQLEIIRTKINQ